jgi:hypothetical protein
MGFGRQAEVLDPAHLRLAVAEEHKVAAEQYTETAAPRIQEDAERKTR